MTGRTGSMSIDRTPISANDVARMEAEEELHAECQRKAIRVVAASAADADDCRTLLSILGLDVGLIADTRRNPPDPTGSKSVGARPPRAA